MMILMLLFKEGVKGSNWPFIVMSVILRIWMIIKVVQHEQKFHKKLD